MNDLTFVGVDVSSDKLDVYVDSTHTWTRFPNTRTGWKMLTACLQELAPERIVLEPTGNYEKGLLKALLAAGLPAARVNAARVRDFAGACGQKAKSDTIDARLLARFGRVMETRVTELPPEDVQRLQELRRYRDFLCQQVVSLRNVLRTADTTAELLKRHLQDFKKKLKEVEAQLKAEVKRRPVIADQVRLLCTTPGIGFLSALALVTELPELGHMSPKKIAALVGVAPYIQESGKYKGQARIFGGRERARKALYMPVLTMIRFNEDLKTVYHRLKGAGKPSKKALVACMRKLLCRLNAMVRDQKPWHMHANT